MDKTKQIIEFLEDRISNLEGYLQDADCSQIEKHDLELCISEYQYICCEVEKIING